LRFLLILLVAITDFSDLSCPTLLIRFQFILILQFFTESSKTPDIRVDNGNWLN